MHFSKRIYFFLRVIVITIGLWVLAAGGFDKWKMMKWAMDKEHHEKSISFSLKPVAIPIPLPLPIPIAMKEKGDTKAAPKPWKAESKDMFWKMMMMKMVMDKGKGDKGKGDKCCPQMVMAGWPPMQKGGGKKASKGSSMCCPSMQMNGGWPMMKSSMKKGGSMMCCPQMMMNGGWSDSGMKACDMMAMMKGGWPMMMKGGWPPPPMCCPMNGGGGGWWPEEEEEEEEPDYYEEEEPMTGWDTMNIPVLALQDQLFFEKMRRKGDLVTQSRNSIIKYYRDKPNNRRDTVRYFFRKGARGLNYDFENDFD